MLKLTPRRLIFTSMASLVFATVVAGPASAAPQCTTHEKMVNLLSKRFSEVPKAVGLVGKKRVMEVYVSKKGSWTIVVTNSGGQACILAAGQSWEDVPDTFAELDPAA